MLYPVKRLNTSERFGRTAVLGCGHLVTADIGWQEGQMVECLLPHAAEAEPEPPPSLRTPAPAPPPVLEPPPDPPRPDPVVTSPAIRSGWCVCAPATPLDLERVLNALPASQQVYRIFDRGRYFVVVVRPAG